MKMFEPVHNKTRWVKNFEGAVRGQHVLKANRSETRA